MALVLATLGFAGGFNVPAPVPQPVGFAAGGSKVPRHENLKKRARARAQCARDGAGLSGSQERIAFNNRHKQGKDVESAKRAHRRARSASVAATERRDKAQAHADAATRTREIADAAAAAAATEYERTEAVCSAIRLAASAAAAAAAIAVAAGTAATEAAAAAAAVALGAVASAAAAAAAEAATKSRQSRHSRHPAAPKMHPSVGMLDGSEVRKRMVARDRAVLDGVAERMMPEYLEAMAEQDPAALDQKEGQLMARARADFRLWLATEAKKKDAKDTTPYYIYMGVGACCKGKGKANPDCLHRFLVEPGWLDKEQGTGEYHKALKGVFSMQGLAACHLIAHSNGGAHHFLNYFPGGEKWNSLFSRDHDPCLCFVAGAYRTQLALCISCHLSNLRQSASYDTECMVCKHSKSPSCQKYSSWPKQVKFVPLGPEGERWDAPVYFKIGRSLVMASLGTTSKIMNLARAVQAHLD